ncbi:MAG: hypothetical protein WCI30_04075 [Clostridia bacterium]
MKTINLIHLQEEQSAAVVVAGLVGAKTGQLAVDLGNEEKVLKCLENKLVLREALLSESLAKENSLRQRLGEIQIIETGETTLLQFIPAVNVEIDQRLVIEKLLEKAKETMLVKAASYLFVCDDQQALTDEKIDLTLVVVKPTQSSLDLFKLEYKKNEELWIAEKRLLVIEYFDLDPEKSMRLIDFALKHKCKIVGRIPFLQRLEYRGGDAQLEQSYYKGLGENGKQAYAMMWHSLTFVLKK